MKVKIPDSVIDELERTIDDDAYLPELGPIIMPGRLMTLLRYAYFLGRLQELKPKSKKFNAVIDAAAHEITSIA
jgi:hypothetical protein